MEGLVDHIPPDPRDSPWQRRVEYIVATMRELSRQSDPDSAVRAYTSRVRGMMKTDGFVSLSRRDLEAPEFRITRSHLWLQPLDPWKDRDRLPLLRGGVLAELVYEGGLHYIEDFNPAPDDPAFEHLKGMRSLLAVPHFENGVCINMVVHLRRNPSGFDPQRFPEIVQVSNLFGRATKNLVLARELREANAALEREMRVIADIQQSLLPRATPLIPGVSLAAHYQASSAAGGDYYDFFELPEGRWGLMIADVAGHGAPAAVLMAILHALAHHLPAHPVEPGATLALLNARLHDRYVGGAAQFVTAFYAVFDPASRRLRYACAGHNPPLLRSADGVRPLDDAQGLPLGVLDDAAFIEGSLTLEPGDLLFMHTDGITESRSRSGEMYGTERLAAAISPAGRSAGEALRAVLDDFETFTRGVSAADDRTALVVRVQ